ncbi:glycosyltransferase [Haliscomenobacter sp.]|uniref:glycosyltransferase n=1 Tax=Haliscomenobacter sp. TaxID=2717303 RepID=UPI003364D897
MPPLKTLVTPLDWGLGHATRCVPLIHAQLAQGNEVHLASSGRALALLRATFPELPSHELPEYAVRYTRTNLYWPLLVQLPKIALAISREQRAVKRLHQRYGFDQVISDHRYGCFVPGAFNAFITHQLHLPVGDWFGGFLAQWRHEYVIAKYFQECWVPDWEEAPGLAGDLSHPPFPKIKTRYLGPLSRLHKLDLPLVYDAAFVISGPEPQRSIWEADIREQVKAFPQKRFFLVQGKPETPFFQSQEQNLHLAPHLDTDDLSALFAQSACVVCRSGYSTLMDLAVTQRPAWLIPTPGQPEQVYLAQKLGTEGLYPWSDQPDFELGKCLEKYPLQ